MRELASQRALAGARSWCWRAARSTESAAADGEDIGCLWESERDDDWEAHLGECVESAVGGAVVDDDDVGVVELGGDFVGQECFEFVVGFVEEGGCFGIDLIEARGIGVRGCRAMGSASMNVWRMRATTPMCEFG